MQGEIIWSKSPFEPPLSLQFRSGDPPYPSSQYPAKFFSFFFFFEFNVKMKGIIRRRERKKNKPVLSPEVVGGQYAFPSTTERHWTSNFE